ncbi:MAG: hypothetical protein JO358_01565 [Alphaproteobacteria bacterium]|nr:hypothetical protein [Alphaproteobacteria bacterium]
MGRRQIRSIAGARGGLVNRQLAAIVTPGAPAVLAAKAATSTIPIVFNMGIDPVQSGLVASFNRPGGNITGIKLLTTELAGKRLELLLQLLPAVNAMALLVNPTKPSNREEETRRFEDAARALGLRAHVLEASAPNQIDAALSAIVERRAEGLIVSGDPFFTNGAARSSPWRRTTQCPQFTPTTSSLPLADR